MHRRGRATRASARLRTPLAQAVLAFVRRNPRASDTVEGIARWWAREVSLPTSVAETQTAVDALVDAGYLIRRARADGTVCYAAGPRLKASRPAAKSRRVVRISRGKGPSND